MISVMPEKDIDQKIFTRLAPFSDKVTSTGKLYRRKHGFSSGTIADGQQETINLVVPYDVCKINELEVVNGVDGVVIDLIVHDTPQGHIQLSMGVAPENVVPSMALNQFGFSVNIPDGFYRDVSQYDADVIKDMEIRVTVTNNTGANYKMKGNIVYHEVKQ